MACPRCRDTVSPALRAMLPSAEEDPELPGRYGEREFGVTGPFVHLPAGFGRPRICSCGTVYCPLVEATGARSGVER